MTKKRKYGNVEQPDDDDDPEYQKEWFRDCRSDVREDVREMAKYERDYRREFGIQNLVGFLVRVGRNCPHAKSTDGLLEYSPMMPYQNPTFLPPFPGCRREHCECEYEPASSASY